MNTYLVIFTIILCIMLLSLRIITILKVRKGEYSSHFVRHLSFFPAEPINTDDVTELTRLKITQLVIVSEIIDIIGFAFLLWPSDNFLLKYFLVSIIFWLLPYFFFKKRLYQYLEL
ncbi:hypothetical protein ACQKKE_01510 [Desemzia incerta]|uniref:hypothetical protein n=1 Tax=Desemzia incerta TaxID=82801 RepID=UPI003D08B1D5